MILRKLLVSFHFVFGLSVSGLGRVACGRKVLCRISVGLPVDFKLIFFFLDSDENHPSNN